MSENIKQTIKEMQELFTGWTSEAEEIFESLLPLYYLQTRSPISKSKWKIINRETSKEFTV